MIKDATHEDIKQIVDLAVEFNTEYYAVPLNTDKFTAALTRILDAPEGVVLLGNGSCILGLLAEDPFRDWVSLVEIGWYSTTGEGIRLLRAFEDRAKQLGADEVRMSTMITSPDVATLLLQRVGYTLAESSYTKHMK